MKDYAAVAFLALYLAGLMVLLAVHIYGCWIIGGLVGVAIFFMPPIPVIVAVAHTLGLI